jgi:plastocyanin
MNRTVTLVVALVAALVVTAPVAGLAPAPAESGVTANTVTTTSNGSTLSLQPASSTAKPGDTNTYEIVLSNVSNGVGAFDNVTIAVNDSAVAEITSISTDVGGDTDSGVDSAGTLAYVNLAFGGDTNDTGDVTIATVEVTANATGTAGLNLTLTGDIARENGELYTVTAVEDGSMSVEGESLDVALDPANQTVANGSTGAYEIVLVNASGGVGSFDNLTVSVPGTSVAEVQSIKSDLTNPESGVASDNATGFINVPFGDHDVDTGDVTVATVVVRANGLGETTLSVTVTGDIADETGNLYRIGAVTGGTVNGTAPPDQSVTEDDEPPTNTDDDALFEDVNGNGAIDIGDIQALFQNQDTETIVENSVFYDFNGNGRIDIGDIQALFEEYRKQS